MRVYAWVITHRTHARHSLQLVQGGDIGVGILGIDFREVSCDYVGVHPLGQVPSLDGGASGSTPASTAPPAGPPAPTPAPVPPEAELPPEAPQQPTPASPEQGAPQQPAEGQPAPGQEAQGPVQAVVGGLVTGLVQTPQLLAEGQQEAADGDQPRATKTLPRFSQCGGAGGACTGSLCRDEPFDGYACATDSTCVRQNR